MKDILSISKDDVKQFFHNCHFLENLHQALIIYFRTQRVNATCIHRQIIKSHWLQLFTPHNPCS